MNDPITTSKSARESLARGLNALQADPSVPAPLVELAQPIAQAMGALHQLEKTSQLAPHADVALNHVRGALAQLQAHPANHPAVAQALEAVATSLSLVHNLSRMANGPAPGGPAPNPNLGVAHAATVQAPPVQQHQPPPAAVASKTAAMPQKGPQAGPPGGHVHNAYAPPQQPSFPQGGPPMGAPQGGGMVARDPFAAPGAGPGPAHAPPQGQGGMGGMGQMHGAPAGGSPVRASIPVPGPPPMQGNVQLVNADLGAHSPTNFYKGLSGNDIIDHGGLFVSTYVIPKINTPVRLKVSLPGGYEFEANAIVKWTREDGGDAPPGFGAQFTAITPEARQLVYRYVRNREPLFHDDL